MITLVGGTMFLMWLGEQITARGIGNGTSLIIMSGIVANLPSAFASMLELGRTGALSPFFILLLRGDRHHHGSASSCSWSGRSAAFRCSIRNARSATGCSAANSTHMPLKINTSGVIPPIFASSILLIPATVAGFATNGPPGCRPIASQLGHGQPLYLGCTRS